VAEKLLSIGQVQFDESIFTVTLPRPPDDTFGRTVKVSGIPRQMSTAMLKSVLQSDKVKGGAIDLVRHEVGQDTATVVFQEEEGNI
jgi:hypothetical protein